MPRIKKALFKRYTIPSSFWEKNLLWRHSRFLRLDSLPSVSVCMITDRYLVNSHYCHTVCVFWIPQFRYPDVKRYGGKSFEAENVTSVAFIFGYLTKLSESKE